MQTVDICPGGRNLGVRLSAGLECGRSASSRGGRRPRDFSPRGPEAVEGAAHRRVQFCRRRVNEPGSFPRRHLLECLALRSPQDCTTLAFIVAERGDSRQGAGGHPVSLETWTQSDPHEKGLILSRFPVRTSAGGGVIRAVRRTYGLGLRTCVPRQRRAALHTP